MSGAAPTTRPAQSSAGKAAGNQNQAHIDQSAKDARMQEHWLKWSGIANTDRTYPVVFDKSPEPLTAELKRIVGASVKTAAVHRVPGLDEEVPAGAKDLGSVQVGLVSAATYATLADTFTFRSITVKLGSGERTAFIPSGRAPQGKKAED
ncbi:hypothetical protein B0I37DRAFT_421406 [Chaetomium sp. MPI-CAGE-AT-0009]|nr:hypothetical protein B0I37DRAFT_421406 [Chaetomium sp. MPI-CAGE-AT-0009]